MAEVKKESKKESKKQERKPISTAALDPVTMKPAQQMPAKLKRKPKPEPKIASPSSGLDWDEIKASFEAVYDPTKSAQAAGRLIARIVIMALKGNRLSSKKNG